MFAKLSNAEQSVVDLVSRGWTNEEVARELHLSSKTVEHHRASLMTKLGLHGQTELVKYAIRAGLVDSA